MQLCIIINILSPRGGFWKDAERQAEVQDGGEEKGKEGFLWAGLNPRLMAEDGLFASAPRVSESKKKNLVLLLQSKVSSV